MSEHDRARLVEAFQAHPVVSPYINDSDDWEPAREDEAERMADVALRVLAPAADAAMQTRWWVSWLGAESFEYHGPWWCSGSEMGGQGRSTFVAAVLAVTDADARQVIVDAHDNADPQIEWRFVDARPSDWDPFTERFPRGDWMHWPITETEDSR